MSKVQKIRNISLAQNLKAKAAFLIAIVLCVGTTSLAQSKADGPIQVSASEIDVQPANNMAIFTGNAEVVQNGAIIRSAKFKVYYGGGNGGKIEKVISDSETFYSSATEKARGDSAVFDANTNTITFIGNVILTQGQNVVTGEELRVNTQSKQSIMKSSNGRVRAVFFPSQKNN
ncbi:MAG: hypothetical protein J0L55_14685 [Caulobacterales bacterium]|nr:hypothetical protein [Caulobacterales bacterium]